jgi:hypothetical protein
MKIEAGKYYRDHDNTKVLVVGIVKQSTDGSVVVLVFWDENGRAFSNVRLLTNFETQAKEYFEPPEIPWDSVPPWFYWWAEDSCGRQRYFHNRPMLFNGGVWKANNQIELEIPDSHRIRHNLSFRNSIFQRPQNQSDQ